MCTACGKSSGENFMANNQCPEQCYQCSNQCVLPKGHPWEQMHNCGQDHSK